MWYVGDSWVCVHLIDTGDGLLLIDSGNCGATAMLVNSIRAAEFKPSDVKWISNVDNYRTINAAAEVNDPDSVYSFYKTLVRLRKEHQVISEGKIGFLFPEDADVLSYRRYGAEDGKELLVLCNLTEHEAPVTLPEGWADAEKLLGNYPDLAASLRPYECVALIR